MRGRRRPAAPVFRVRGDSLRSAAFFILLSAPAGAGIVAAGFVLGDHRRFGRRGLAAGELQRGHLLFLLALDVARQVENGILGGLALRFVNGRIGGDGHGFGLAAFVLVLIAPHIGMRDFELGFSTRCMKNSQRMVSSSMRSIMSWNRMKDSFLY